MVISRRGFDLGERALGLGAVLVIPIFPSAWPISTSSWSIEDTCRGFPGRRSGAPGVDDDPTSGTFVTVTWRTNLVEALAGPADLLRHVVPEGFGDFDVSAGDRDRILHGRSPP
jgi:hypothetical protein